MSRFVSQALAIPVTENISPITSRFTNRCLYSTPGAYTFTVPSGVCCITAVAVGPGAKQCEILNKVEISIPMCGLVRSISHCTQDPLTLCSVVAGGPTSCAHRQLNSICITACHCSVMNYCGCNLCCFSATNCSGASVYGCMTGGSNYNYFYTYIPNGAGGGYAEKAVTTAPGCTFCVIVGSHCGTSIANTPFSCVQGAVCATGLTILTSDCLQVGFDCFKTPSDAYNCMTTALANTSALMCYSQCGSANYSWTKCCVCIIPGCGYGGDINRVGGNSLCCYCAKVDSAQQCLVAYQCYADTTSGICTKCYYVFGTCALLQKMQHAVYQQLAFCDWLYADCAACACAKCCGCYNTGFVDLQMLSPGSSQCGACQVFGTTFTCPIYPTNCTIIYAHRGMCYQFQWRHCFTNLGNVCSFATCAPGTYDLTCNQNYFSSLQIIDCAGYLECHCCGTVENKAGEILQRSAFLHASTILFECPITTTATPFYKFGGSSAGNYYGAGVSSLSDAATYALACTALCDSGLANCSCHYGCIKTADNRCGMYDVTMCGQGTYQVCCQWGCGGPCWTCTYSTGSTQHMMFNHVAMHCAYYEPGGINCLYCAYDPACGSIGCLNLMNCTCECWYTRYNTPCHFSADFLDWLAINPCYVCKYNNRGIKYNPCTTGCNFMCVCFATGSTPVIIQTFVGTECSYNHDKCCHGFETGPFMTCEANSDTLPLIVHQSFKGTIKPRISRVIDAAVSNFGFKGDHFTVECYHTAVRCGGCSTYSTADTYNTNIAVNAGCGVAQNCAGRAGPWTRYNYYGTCYDNHNRFYNCTYALGEGAMIGCQYSCMSFGAPSYIDTTWNYNMYYYGVHCNYPCCIGYNYGTATCKPANYNPLINVYDYVCTKMMSNRDQTDSASEACLILCNWKGWIDHNKYSLGIKDFPNFLSALYAACATYDSTYCCVFESINCLQVCDRLFGIGQVHCMMFQYNRHRESPACSWGVTGGPCYNCAMYGRPTSMTPPRCSSSGLTVPCTPVSYGCISLKCCGTSLSANTDSYQAQGGAGTATAGTWASSQATCTLLCSGGGNLKCVVPCCNIPFCFFDPGPSCCGTCCLCRAPGFGLGPGTVGLQVVDLTGCGAGALIAPQFSSCSQSCGWAQTIGGCTGYVQTYSNCAHYSSISQVDMMNAGGSGYSACTVICANIDSSVWRSGCHRVMACNCFGCWIAYCNGYWVDTAGSFRCLCFTTTDGCTRSGSCNNPIIQPLFCAIVQPSYSCYQCVTAYQSLGSGGGACSGVNNVSKCIDVVDSSIIKSVRPGRGGRGNEVDYEPYYYSYPGISAQLSVPIAPCCYVGDATASGCTWFDTNQIRGSGGNGTFTSAFLACIPAQGPGPGGGGPVGCDGNSCLLGAGGVLAGGGGCCGAGGYGGGAGWCGTPGTGMVVIYWNA